MSQLNVRPLLLVDVDGVISLFGFEAADRPPGRFLLVDGIPHYISNRAGECLRRLSDAFELVWCTGWEEKAREHLPAALGLPGDIAHLTFAPPEAAAHGHWKLAAIDRHAGARRPLAWVDDVHTAACRSWARRRTGPTLLVTTRPDRGLEPAHTDELLRWACALTGAE